MKKLGIFLVTALNVGSALVSCRNGIAPAAAGSTSAVVRARKLEIVDDAERVRATIEVLPGPHAGTSILRLIDENGRPEVKLAASDEGSGLSIIGATDADYLVLSADEKGPVFRVMQHGREHNIVPQ
jgi:hypothetical protein